VLAKMSSAADAYCAATTWTEIAEKTLSEMTKAQVRSFQNNP
jgi:hypothetical protein